MAYIPPSQLADMGAKWVILGHSERREYFKEDNEMLRQKLEYALSKGLKVIFCIGEKLEERNGGKTLDVCKSQLEPVKDLLKPETVVIAYEPVWAIGTGVTATPEQAQETHKQIRDYLATVNADMASKIRIQYGGSANAANAPTLSACPDIDGFLVGGASLKVLTVKSLLSAHPLSQPAGVWRHHQGDRGCQEGLDVFVVSSLPSQ
eukprot:768799-Hanusia_phi.AAC.4